MFYVVQNTMRNVIRSESYSLRTKTLVRIMTVKLEQERIKIDCKINIGNLFKSLFIYTTIFIHQTVSEVVNERFSECNSMTSVSDEGIRFSKSDANTISFFLLSIAKDIVKLLLQGNFVGNVVQKCIKLWWSFGDEKRQFSLPTLFHFYVYLTLCSRMVMLTCRSSYHYKWNMTIFFLH